MDMDPKRDARTPSNSQTIANLHTRWSILEIAHLEHCGSVLQRRVSIDPCRPLLAQICCTLLLGIDFGVLMGFRFEVHRSLGYGTIQADKVKGGMHEGIDR